MPSQPSARPSGNVPGGPGFGSCASDGANTARAKACQAAIAGWPGPPTIPTGFPPPKATRNRRGWRGPPSGRGTSAGRDGCPGCPAAPRRPPAPRPASPAPPPPGPPSGGCCLPAKRGATPRRCPAGPPGSLSAPHRLRHVPPGPGYVAPPRPPCPRRPPRRAAAQGTFWDASHCLSALALRRPKAGDGHRPRPYCSWDVSAPEAQPKPSTASLVRALARPLTAWPGWMPGASSRGAVWASQASKPRPSRMDSSSRWPEDKSINSRIKTSPKKVSSAAGTALRGPAGAEASRSRWKAGGSASIRRNCVRNAPGDTPTWLSMRISLKKSDRASAPTWQRNPDEYSAANTSGLSQADPASASHHSDSGWRSLSASARRCRWTLLFARPTKSPNARRLRLPLAAIPAKMARLAVRMCWVVEFFCHDRKDTGMRQPIPSPLRLETLWQHQCPGLSG